MMCANCGCDSPKGETYYKVKDNYLLVNYFDTDEDSVFCSQDCLCDAISADLEICEEDTEDDLEIKRILNEAKDG